MLSNHIKRYVRTCHTFNGGDAVDRSVVLEDILPRLLQVRADLVRSARAEGRNTNPEIGTRKRTLEALATLRAAIRTATRTLSARSGELGADANERLVHPVR
ncbi:hypothetical protein BSFA1_80760 (plasmid) [Burkholderia sp. SFA1]|nr:hypothetical protein BSFA1_80760 [Burkholderia sp. SFA1]